MSGLECDLDSQIHELFGGVAQERLLVKLEAVGRVPGEDAGQFE